MKVVPVKKEAVPVKKEATKKSAPVKKEVTKKGAPVKEETVVVKKEKKVFDLPGQIREPPPEVWTT